MSEDKKHPGSQGFPATLNSLSNQLSAKLSKMHIFDFMDTPSVKKRPEQLKEIFNQLILQHLDDLVHHRAENMYEIEDFADLMCIHPTHLSNTIKEVTGRSACDLYQRQIITTARQLLADPERSIREIALLLTFEPSNFTKWFKRFTQVTPKAYRQSLATINT